jgi:hypothetical protein
MSVLVKSGAGLQPASIVWQVKNLPHKRIFMKAIASHNGLATAANVRELVRHNLWLCLLSNDGRYSAVTV